MCGKLMCFDLNVTLNSKNDFGDNWVNQKTFCDTDKQ